MEDELCDKYFVKLLGDLGKSLHEEWKKLEPKPVGIGIGPRVFFVFHKLEEKCKEVTMQEQIKKQAWAFCKTSIYTPQAYGYYEKPKKQKYIRKNTTFDKHKKIDKN